VTWRDGVHLSGTPIWCDARRRRDVCFVSSAERVGKSGHGQLIGTPITLALLGAVGHGHLAVPLLRPFTLGTLRLELIPSGRGLGAAALHVDLGGRTVLYAGAIRTSASGRSRASTDDGIAKPRTRTEENVGLPRSRTPTDGIAKPRTKTDETTRAFIEPAQVRACDAVVVAAPRVVSDMEPVMTVAERLAWWVREQLTAQRRPIIGVDTISDAFEVAAQLAARGITVAGTKSLREAAERLAPHAQLPAIDALGKELVPVVRIDGDKLKVPAADRAISAVVSAHTQEAPAGWDIAFAWPFVASRSQLLAWIEQTRANEVFITGDGAEDIATELGARARIIGPPHQMTLFPREATR
jgi:hypothetical protein